MEEKQKRIVTKIGDIFCAEIDGTYKVYFQYIAIDKEQLGSSVIRVFKKRYDISDGPKLENIVNDDVEFHVHVFLSWGIRMGLWEKVGKVKFEESVRLPFKTFNNNNREILPHDWRVWYTNELAMYLTGPLPEEFRHAEWGEVKAPTGIIERMRRNGKHSGYTVRDEEILRQNIDFAQQRELLMMPWPWGLTEEEASAKYP